MLITRNHTKTSHAKKSSRSSQTKKQSQSSAAQHQVRYCPPNAMDKVIKSLEHAGPKRHLDSFTRKFSNEPSALSKVLPVIATAGLAAGAAYFGAAGWAETGMIGAVKAIGMVGLGATGISLLLGKTLDRSQTPGPNPGYNGPLLGLVTLGASLSSTLLGSTKETSVRSAIGTGIGVAAVATFGACLNAAIPGASLIPAAMAGAIDFSLSCMSSSQ